MTQIITLFIILNAFIIFFHNSMLCLPFFGKEGLTSSIASILCKASNTTSHFILTPIFNKLF